MKPRQIGAGMGWIDSFLAVGGKAARRVIVSTDELPATRPAGTLTVWIHASLSRPDRMPDYEDLKHLHQAVFGDGWAYQVFAPPAEHVNGHETCLHLFGRADGLPVLPDFTHGLGEI